MIVEVTSGVLATLRAEAARSAPRECCGVLLGRGDRIEEVMPAANLAERPEIRFEIDPVVLLAAHKAARAREVQVIGYYHSHPSGRAVPSPTDRERASGDGRIWAIVAGDEVAFWQDTDHGFEAAGLRVC
ncbi:MAG TPA: M67 family metallopeptidase [Novosphingobium sp.]|nr:M67 family metallopeptidase [Novosphingobium sp.]